MNEQYDPKRFFEFLGFDPGDQEYESENLETVNVFCRGDREQLERLLEPTPFTLESDIFQVTVADFANCTMTQGRYFDGGVLLAVSYGEHRAGTYFFEFEDEHWSTAAGRELWGYPKRYAKISMDVDDHGAKGSIWSYETPVLDIAVEFDDSVDPAAWSEAKLSPTMQVRAVPELNGPSFSQFDISLRDTAANFKLKQRLVGRASVKLGAVDIGSGLLGGEPLRVFEVLGGEHTVGDFAATRTHGTPVVLDSLI